MKILLERGIISAVVFANLFLVAATPIPVPLADSESSVVPVESFKHTVPTTPSIVTVPLVVDIEDGPELFPRDPTDKDTSKETTNRLIIMVPAEFLPQRSNQVMMRVPIASEHNGWSSVLYILKLMDAAVVRSSELAGPRKTFQKQLEKRKYAKNLEIIASNIKENRKETEDLHPEDPSILTLEQLQNRIQEEATNLGMFSGEQIMPLVLIPRGLKIGMKVPHPWNKEAVESVEAILHFLRSGVSDGAEKAKDLNQWCNYKLRLTKSPFNLKFAKEKRQMGFQSWDNAELLAFQINIIQLVRLHNNNQWIEKGNEGNGPPRAGSVRIPVLFVPKDWEPQYPNLHVPPSTDKLGVDSLKNILQMMAH
ncbi:hypothetical protein H0H93_011321, partial [Arthromyces matolae]